MRFQSSIFYVLKNLWVQQEWKELAILRATYWAFNWVLFVRILYNVERKVDKIKASELSWADGSRGEDD